MEIPLKLDLCIRYTNKKFEPELKVLAGLIERKMYEPKWVHKLNDLIDEVKIEIKNELK